MSFEGLFAKLRRDIEEHGWSTIGVFSAEGDESSTPPFSYTVGFMEHDHPELIIAGLPPETAHTIMHGLYVRVAAGERFEDGQLDSQVLEGYDVRFQAMPPDGRPLNVARRYYRRDELPALQVLWPDKEGVFPDEPGCDPKMAVRQDLTVTREE